MKRAPKPSSGSLIVKVASDLESIRVDLADSVQPRVDFERSVDVRLYKVDTCQSSGGQVPRDLVCSGEIEREIDLGRRFRGVRKTCAQ